jgi:Cd2+/Zn2+-exporting ATPase
LLATALCGLLIALGALATLLDAPSLVSTILFGAAIAVGGYHIFRKALGSLRFSRELDINVLMTLAVLGAGLIGEWPEGAMVVFLFSVGEALEGHTMGRARRAIESLMALAPAEATVLRPCLDCARHRGNVQTDGRVYQEGPCPWCEPHQVRVPVEELAVGETILVRPGERVPMDGQVLRGQSAVNQAPITGESLPVSKEPGQEVFAGTINGNGVLYVTVTRLAADNTLSRLVHMVEEAQSQKAPAQRWVDRFARLYTPIVVGAAVLVAVIPPVLLNQPFLNGDHGTGWLYRALTLLVIACPCALVLSTPVSIVSAISAGARNGVLIKGGIYLESLGRLRVMAFDKTGTLTRGEPALTETQCFEHHGDWNHPVCASCDDLLALAAAVERQSEHPLAKAVVTAAQGRRLQGRYQTADGVKAVTGRGVRGVVNGQAVGISSHHHVHELDLCQSEDFCRQVSAVEAAGQTILLVHTETGVQGYLAVADQIRPAAKRAIQALKTQGIEHMVMLTGDNEASARSVASQLGIEDVRAGLLPEEKIAAVEDLVRDFQAVAMVGDGVNDAPALARATVGIAMGGAGTDQALETADVALMGDDLQMLPFALQLGRSALHTIRENVAFSLALKAIFVLLALTGMATLWMAVFADVGASIIVILNGMRLLRAAPKTQVHRQQ